MNNNKSLYNNANNNINNFGFNSKNLLDKNYIHNRNDINYNNNININNNLNNISYTNNNNKYFDINNYYNLNEFPLNIKDLNINIKNKLDINKMTQLQQYNQSFNDSKNINNNNNNKIYELKEFPINYSTGKKNKLFRSKYNNFIQENNLINNSPHNIITEKQLYNKMNNNKVIQNNYIRTQDNFYPNNISNLINDFNYFQ